MQPADCVSPLSGLRTRKSIVRLTGRFSSVSRSWRGLAALAGSNNESWCQGLDGLASRTAAYKKQGARFAKWRTVISIPNGPLELAVTEAAWGLARYLLFLRTLEVAEKVWSKVFFLTENNVTLLKRRVPPSVPGIMFLSGG
ncbi:unnamed protein product [Sphagnum jensenii]|uniref:fructose-bisphosphate aldolase n=1 Tax=Sphagnum jensenii TaxID=128206 RepID=A0ABP1A9C3_9BRYO